MPTDMKLWRRFHRNTKATTVIEFALLAPIYLLLIFGILEIGLALLFSQMLAVAADRGADYLIQERQAYRTPTATGLRSAMCEVLGGTPVSCTADKLKLTLMNIDALTASSMTITRPIDNRFDNAATGALYMLAAGYTWGFVFPSTILVLPFSGPDAQMQSVELIVMAERVTE